MSRSIALCKQKTRDVLESLPELENHLAPPKKCFCNILIREMSTCHWKPLQKNANVESYLYIFVCPTGDNKETSARATNHIASMPTMKHVVFDFFGQHRLTVQPYGPQHPTYTREQFPQLHQNKNCKHKKNNTHTTQKSGHG